MEPRDVIPPVDLAQQEREPVSRPEPVIEPRWLDVDTAAKYLCMTRHALYHRMARCQLPFIRHGRLLRFDRDGARPLDGEGGEVWLCGSAAASGTSGR